MKRAASITTYTILALWSLVCLFPLYWVAVTSLKGAREIIAGPVYMPFVDYAPNLDAWNYILADSSDNPLLRYLNSVIVGSISTVLTVILGGLAVYGCTRFRHRIGSISVALLLLAATFAIAAYCVPAAGERWLAIAIAGSLIVLFARHPGRGPSFDGSAILLGALATRILPPIVIVLPVYLMAQQVGALDTRLALIVAYTASNLPVASTSYGISNAPALLRVCPETRG